MLLALPLTAAATANPIPFKFQFNLKRPLQVHQHRSGNARRIDPPSRRDESGPPPSPPGSVAIYGQRREAGGPWRPGRPLDALPIGSRGVNSDELKTIPMDPSSINPDRGQPKPMADESKAINQRAMMNGGGGGGGAAVALVHHRPAPAFKRQSDALIGQLTPGGSANHRQSMNKEAETR